MIEDPKTALLDKTDSKTTATKYRINHALGLLCAIFMLGLVVMMFGPAGKHYFTTDTEEGVGAIFAEENVETVVADPHDSQMTLGDPALDEGVVAGDYTQCLEANQMVLSKTRGEVMIKHLVSGERVKTCDGDWTTFLYNDHQNKHGMPERETDVDGTEFYSLYFSNGRNLKLTWNHFFELENHEFVFPQDLKIGDRVVNIDSNGPLFIEKIEMVMGTAIDPITINHRIVVNGVCATHVNQDTSLYFKLYPFVKHIDLLFNSGLVPQAYFTYCLFPMVHFIQDGYDGGIWKEIVLFIHVASWTAFMVTIAYYILSKQYDVLFNVRKE